LSVIDQSFITEHLGDGNGLMLHVVQWRCAATTSLYQRTTINFPAMVQRQTGMDGRN
jgi:hypothetical protein